MKNKDTFIYNTFNWNIRIVRPDYYIDEKMDVFVFKITKSIILNFVHFR